MLIAALVAPAYAALLSLAEVKAAASR